MVTRMQCRCNRNNKKCFFVGWPSNITNGTEGVNVYPTKSGITVFRYWWNDKMERAKLKKIGEYSSIDKWMEEEYDEFPSTKKSRPKKNYRGKV